MPVKPKFNFGFGILTQEADYILDASEAHDEINARLPANFVSQQRSRLDSVRGADSSQKGKIANVGGLTASQDSAWSVLNELVSQARDSAKRAFKGQDVKLRNEFQVGINSPGDLASVLQRARIVRDSAANAGNATALTAKGWLATDTTALSNAIDALDSTDDSQETAKVDKAGSTDARNSAGNELYEGLLTIQNAADIQWPERVSANVTVRAEFRLGQFPPKQERKKQFIPVPSPLPTPS
jgi:hypothetical protein